MQARWHFCPRLRARRIYACWRGTFLQLFVLGLLSTAAPAHAASTQPVGSPERESVVVTTGVVPLSLDEAQRLAVTDQPLLNSRAALIDAQAQQAVSAAQLPDPKLLTGLRDVPIDTRDAFNLRRDNFTEFTVGVSQEIPRFNKRRLLGERKTLEADVARASLDDEQRAVQRDTALAWLDVYAAEQGLVLGRRAHAEAALQLQAVEKDYVNGRAAQSDWYAAKVDEGIAGDKEHDWLHHVQLARAELGRWIGEQEAQRQLGELVSPAHMQETANEQRMGGSLADIKAAQSLPQLLLRVETHPQLRGMQKQIDVATTDIALAKQSYKPDVTIEGYFAYRQDFSDFVGLQVSVDLPLFTRNRQDRNLAAAVRLADASAQQSVDLQRRLRAEVTQRYVDRLHYNARLRDFDKLMLPESQQRIEAARSAYAAGRGTFDAVLLARRSRLDVQLQRLAVAVDAARAQVRLRYLVGEGVSR